MLRSVGIFLGLALTWLGYTLFLEAAHIFAAENVDPTRAVVVFGEVVLVGLTTGIVFVTTLMPAVAEWMGNFFFNPDEEIEKPRHAKALAAVARGDHAAAIREYTKAWKRDPDDVTALRELSLIYCEKLDDPESALKVVESALGSCSSDEAQAAIHALLADIYWPHLQDAGRAREILEQIVRDIPNSRASMEAERRLREIDRELVRGTGA